MKRGFLLFLFIFLFSNTVYAENVNTLQIEDGTEVYIDKSADLISSFKTKFNTKNTNRSSNLQLACEAINGIVLEPKETFSFNKVLGPTSEERGYKKAKVFYKGKETKNYGGGICQVSSTLYNAVLGSSLEVEEVHHHSKDVGYIEKGKDATVSGRGKLDLKFTNSYDLPIIILSDVIDNQIVVEIFFVR